MTHIHDYSIIAVTCLIEDAAKQIGIQYLFPMDMWCKNIIITSKWHDTTLFWHINEIIIVFVGLSPTQQPMSHDQPLTHWPLEAEPMLTQTYVTICHYQATMS